MARIESDSLIGPVIQPGAFLTEELFGFVLFAEEIFVRSIYNYKILLPINIKYSKILIVTKLM